MPEKPEELLLLTYSPVLHEGVLHQLLVALEEAVVTINGKIYAITDVRVDQAAHAIYGRGEEITPYEEFQ
ncbi:MAG: hypothetical protein J2P36_05005 [Ktedonobacteraceae bacterium]|nr:hypothetical protein [Ktedonobacteraceae bacterium]